jgi:hypothetical protein
VVARGAPRRFRTGAGAGTAAQPQAAPVAAQPRRPDLSAGAEIAAHPADWYRF